MRRKYIILKLLTGLSPYGHIWFNYIYIIHSEVRGKFLNGLETCQMPFGHNCSPKPFQTDGSNFIKISKVNTNGHSHFWNNPPSLFFLSVCRDRCIIFAKETWRRNQFSERSKLRRTGPVLFTLNFEKIQDLRGTVTPWANVDLSMSVGQGRKLSFSLSLKQIASKLQWTKFQFGYKWQDPARGVVWLDNRALAFFRPLYGWKLWFDLSPLICCGDWWRFSKDTLIHIVT